MEDLNEIFVYVANRGRSGAPEFENTYISALKKAESTYQRYQVILRALEYASQYSVSRGKCHLVFVGYKFPDLIQAISKDYAIRVLAQGKRDLIKSLVHGISVSPVWTWQVQLYRAYVERSEENRSRILEHTVRSIANMLARLQPIAVVLWNDSLFLERAVIAAARRVGIPSITIQHGIFMESSPVYVLDGHFTDFMLVWGGFFKKLYIEKAILPGKRVLVLGYPYTIRRVSVGRSRGSRQKKMVCLLGQPWEKYDERLREAKYDIIRNVIRASRRAGLALVYRPHPSEDRRRVTRDFPELRLTPRRQTLEEAINSYDVFLSITSTALVEAALRGKVVAQIRSKEFVQDDFEKLGVAYRVENSIDDIEEFLVMSHTKDVEPKGVDPNYVHVPLNLKDSFNRALEAIGIGASPRADA